MILHISIFRNWKCAQISQKSGFLKFFGSICGLYTCNSARKENITLPLSRTFLWKEWFEMFCSFFLDHLDWVRKCSLGCPRMWWGNHLKCLPLILMHLRCAELLLPQVFPSGKDIKSPRDDINIQNIYRYIGTCNMIKIFKVCLLLQ